MQARGGFVDLQVNGYAAVDFNADKLVMEDVAAVCRRLRDDGVAGIVATVITAELDAMIEEQNVTLDPLAREALLKKIARRKHETVLGGTDEALAARSVDFAITSRLPPGFIGDVLLQVRALCVAAPSHPLHHLGRPATLDDLRRHRHLVVRDSGVHRTRSAGFLNEQRWTVSHKATSLHAIVLGYGYAWFPDEAIRGELERGALLPVPLREGAERQGPLYLVFADRDAAGPGALRLADIIRTKVSEECSRQLANSGSGS